MNIKVKSIQPTTKPYRLAEAIIELADADGDSLIIRPTNTEAKVAKP